MTSIKHEKFKKLANKRLKNAVQNIRLIGNLSNTHNYSFTEEEFKTIFNLLEEEIKFSKTRYTMVLNKKRKISI